MKKVIAKMAAPIALAIAMSAGVSANEIKWHGINNERPAAFTPISCSEARKMLVSHGFTHLRARDCSGMQYRFEAKRQEVAHVILFSPESGGWVALPR